MKKKARLTIDSREQKSLLDTFNKDRFDSITVDGLPFADYWCSVYTDGTWTEVPIVVERKSLGDLYGTMTNGYERFKRELERCKENNCHMILAIEETIDRVHQGYEHSQFSGDAMLKKLGMMQVRYGLEVHYFNGRRAMARWIEELFDACARNLEHSPSANSGRQ